MVSPGLTALLSRCVRLLCRRLLLLLLLLLWRRLLGHGSAGARWRCCSSALLGAGHCSCGRRLLYSRLLASRCGCKPNGAMCYACRLAFAFVAGRLFLVSGGDDLRRRRVIVRRSLSLSLSTEAGRREVGAQGEGGAAACGSAQQAHLEEFLESVQHDGSCFMLSSISITFNCSSLAPRLQRHAPCHFSSTKHRLSGRRSPDCRRVNHLRPTGSRTPDSRCFVEEKWHNWYNTSLFLYRSLLPGLLAPPRRAPIRPVPPLPASAPRRLPPPPPPMEAPLQPLGPCPPAKNSTCRAHSQGFVAGAGGVAVKMLTANDATDVGRGAAPTDAPLRCAQRRSAPCLLSSSRACAAGRTPRRHQHCHLWPGRTPASHERSAYGRARPSCAYCTPPSATHATATRR